MKTEKIRISRRSFLQAAGLLTLSAGFSACGSQGTSSGTQEETLLEDAVRAEFTDAAVTLRPDDASGCTVDGTTLTITAAGTYAVSGSCADGCIRVEGGIEDVVLVLNGLTLTSEITAPLVCGKASGVTIAASDGTENTLADTEANNKDSETASENAENAVIKCKDGAQVILCGKGTLNLAAAGKNGIKAGAAQDERDASLTIRELTLNIDAPVNDAINAEQFLLVESGTLTIAAGDDAVHSDLYLNIGAEGTDGPSITVSTCYEGLEAAELNIYSGTIDITATDDCLNAANSDLGDYPFCMNIAGGAITAYSSEGDGLDSNGTLTISGGSISVWTANTADNQPLDADGTISITGGTVLAAGGSAGMGNTLEAGQPCVSFGGSRDALSLTAGSEFSICSADGTALYTAQAACGAGYVFFTSPELTEEESYTLTFNGSATAQAQTGTISDAQPGGQGGRQMPPDGQMPDAGQRPEGQAPGKGQPPQDAAAGSEAA